MIDFEGSAQIGVVEYGCALIKHGKIIGTQTNCCKPSGRLLPQDELSYGLRQKELSNLRHFSDERELFMHLYGSVDLFGAHHSVTEENMLKMHWPYPVKRKTGQSCTWGPWLDTRIIYENLYPTLGNFKLSHLIKTFDLEEELTANAAIHCPPERRKPHCALYDALAAALLINRFKGISEIACTSLEWMLQASASGKKNRLKSFQLSLF